MLFLKQMRTLRHYVDLRMHEQSDAPYLMVKGAGFDFSYYFCNSSLAPFTSDHAALSAELELS